MYSFYSNRLFIISSIVVLCMAVFAIDRIIPLGVAGGIPYIIPILLTYRLNDTVSTLIVAIACTGLTILGLYYSPEGADIWQVLMNRSLALFVIWVTAWFIIFRKHSENLLCLSEEHFRLAQEAAGVATFEWDFSNNEVKNSVNHFALYGLSSNKNISDYEDWIKFLHPDNKDQAIKDVQQILEHPDQQHLSIYRVIWPDGTIHWHEKRGKVIFNKINQPTKMIGTITDITERKQAEEYLYESEKKYRGLLESDPSGMVIINSRGEIEIVNEQLEKLTGYNRRELVGQSIEVLVPDKFKAGHKKLRNNFLKSPRTRLMGNGKLEFSVLCKDGGTFLAEISLSPLQAKDGLIVSAAVLDITKRKKTESNLLESEKRFRSLYESSRDALVLTNDRNCVLDGNRAMLELFGYKNVEELISTNVTDRSPPVQPNGEKSSSLSKKWHDKVLSEGTAFFEWEYRRIDGTTFPAEVRLNTMRVEGETLIYAVIRDIAERKQTERELIESEERFRSAFDQAAVPTVITGTDGRFIRVNHAMCELVGYNERELLDMDWVSITFPDDVKDDEKYFKQLVTGKINKYLIEKRYFHKSGETIWALLNVSSVYDATGKLVYTIAQVQDITKSRQLSEQLSYQATHDALTSLINRREFEHRLDRILVTARIENSEHALCYLDLDQFKVINDTCGHIAGDELLRQLSILLHAAVRKRDTLARLGGDEFGVLMEHCTPKQAKRVANKLRKAIEEFRFVWEDKSFSIGVSIGLVPITREAMNSTEILKQADAACYAAKDAGRNRVHVYQASDTELARRHGEMQWVAEINRALEADRFCLYAQIIVPVKRRRKTGPRYELLLRMRDEANKLVLPGAFLGAAERYNLSTRLDRWVVDTYFDWLMAHPGHAEDLSQCAINLSGLSLGDEQFLGYIVERFKETRLPAEKICFEVTETAAITNLTNAMTFMKKLKRLGCKFALDDFGSGLSSFAYLKTLPVDYLKIDGLFVKDIETDPIDLAMVKSINDIGKVMGKQTIAEFVENEGILDILKKIKVDYAQGYGVGRPQPIEDILVS